MTIQDLAAPGELIGSPTFPPEFIECVEEQRAKAA